MAYGTVNTDIVSDSSGGRLAPISSVFRNRIINGGCVIDQRNAGASVTVNSTTTQYAVDRFQARGDSVGVFTIQQSSTAPAGFVNSLVATVTTPDSSIAAGRIYFLRQNIEGFNVADLNWGTANAKTVTLSFWVYSSLTGNFGGAIQNNSNARSYPFSYTVSSANTWTQVSVTIAGDTTGTWTTNNTSGMRIDWCLGAGSTFTTTANSWAAGEYYGFTGQTQLISTNGATFYITGVQLEVGSSATGYEYRQYGQELALCQRYYYQSTPTTYNGVGSGVFISGVRTNIYIKHPVSMRTAPTWGYSGTITMAGTGNYVASAILVYYAGLDSSRVDFTVSGATSGQGCMAFTNNGSTDYVYGSAEL